MDPTAYLDPARIQALEVDILYAVYPDGTTSPTSAEPQDVYQPVDRVPAVILCRTSDSEKRLEGPLTSVEVARGAWGVLFAIHGGGVPVGAALMVQSGAFCGAHALPDMVHLLACVEVLPEDSIMKGLYESKSFRVFQLGLLGRHNTKQDLVITTKARWFRSRNNPKFLGFAKDEKP